MKIVVVGGGLVGTAVARALATRGADVVVVERGVPGAEASWAAGGILSPQAECDVDGPMLRLCLAGLRATVDLCSSFSADVGLKKTGVVDVAADEVEADALMKRVEWQRAIGLSARWLTRDEVKARVPVGEVVGAAAFDDEASLEPRRLFELLRAQAMSAGVRFVTGRRVVSVDDKRVTLDEGALHGDAVVVCAGAWTPQVEGAGVDADAIFPVRGQMIELSGLDCSCVVYGCGGYAVPRDGARVVVGSTMERVGFDKRVTAEGVLRVLSSSTRLLPALKDAAIVSTWAGLRPATSTGLPLLGKSKTGVWVASGHFRNGILLAVISGERIAGALLDDVAIDPAFAP